MYWWVLRDGVNSIRNKSLRSIRARVAVVKRRFLNYVPRDLLTFSPQNVQKSYFKITN